VCRSIVTTTTEWDYGSFRAHLMTSWKKLATVGASVGAGIVALLAVIGLGVYWYYFHPRPARDWPDVEIAPLGFKTSLSTKWSGGHLNYQFRVSPISRTHPLPDLAFGPEEETKAFNKAIQGKSQPFRFSVLLLDSAGFKLCTLRIADSDLQSEIDDAGKTKSLAANGSETLYCSLGEYNQASSWNPTWEYFPTVEYIVQAPDGTVHHFPVGTDPAVINRAMKDYISGGKVSSEPVTLDMSKAQPIVQPDWKDKSHWRMLKKGMSKNDVLKLLGGPRKTQSGGVLEYWYYSRAGISGPHVTFDQNETIWGWDEP
jgi:hypothetical protein